MPTIEDQIALEKRMVAYGITRHRNSVKSAEEAGRGADTQYAQKLMQEFIEPVAESINSFCTDKRAVRQGKYKPLMRLVDANKIAYFGMRALFNHFMQDSTLHKLANNIGMMVEDEIKFSKFQQEHGDYYDAIIKDFKQKGTKNYRHMHRVLTFKANEKEVRWGKWSNEERAAVGVKVIDCILEATDLVQKRTVYKRRKTHILIEPTPQALEWIDGYNEFAQLLNPDRVPCIIEPDNWTHVDQGGYYTPQLRKRTPMVKTKSRAHFNMFEGDMHNITDAVNSLQQVPWAINEEMMAVFKQAWDQSINIGLPQSEPYVIPDCPFPKDLDKSKMSTGQLEIFNNWKAEARVVHTMEKERVAKCFQVIRVMRLASEFEQYDRFWYVYQCDFRGRIYATTSGLSPQGPDFSKALIHFADGKELTEKGLKWLRIHGANMFGYDKESYDDRVKWVIEREDRIKAVADDPLGNHDLWTEADKPWQFLAFCYEYRRYMEEGISMKSHLPIALDGSCNGLQNFSAMLQDEVGGAATNLIPSEKPSDIYSEVAKVCATKLRESEELEAQEWIGFLKTNGNEIPRGMAKKPVMTLPYGSTQQSCRESIYKYLVEEMPDAFTRDARFQASVFLTPIMWDSIGDVVVAARQAMDWIQECAGILAKANKPVVWWTPIGFPVLQDRRKMLINRVSTQLNGAFQIKVAVDSPTIDVLKSKLGSSPNFVHSMDACHLMLTINKAREKGLTHFAAIHDDFGTYAADTDEFQQTIREAFVWLYDQNSPLIDFKIFNEDQSGIELPDPPSRGSLKLGQILDSKYFFG